MTAYTIQAGCWRRFPREILHCPGESPGSNMCMFAMAIDAPTHGEWSDLLDSLHPFHRPVTSLARYARQHMLAVIEVHEVGKVVNLHPTDRPLELHGLLELLDLGSLFFEQVVAVHADTGGRNSGMTARSRRVVAIETGNFVVPSMDLMRKCDGLLRRIALVNPDPGELPCNQTATQDQTNAPSDYNSRAHLHVSPLPAKSGMPN